LAIAGTLPVAPARSSVIGGTVDPEQAPTAPVIPASAGNDATMVRQEIDLEAEEHASPRSPIPTSAPLAPGTAIHPAAVRDGVEVRCRFGDRWVTGFEVCEVIRFDDEIRYRLRRRSDGSVLPTLFDEQDLRFFTTSFADQ
jgi:hypothetical protein